MLSLTIDPKIVAMRNHFLEENNSGTSMTGRPGGRLIEMNGGSTASYLACTPRVRLFMILIGLETKRLLDFQGRRGITSVVRWTVRPVIFGVNNFVSKHYKIINDGSENLGHVKLAEMELQT